MARPIRVAINGFGRIGKMTLRALLERQRSESFGPLFIDDHIRVVAINELTPLDEAAQLFQRDTVHGRFFGSVRTRDGSLVVNDEDIRFLSEPDPTKLPWNDLEVDVVLECTGRFVEEMTVCAHLASGAKRVIVSAPAKGVPMIVYGVNDGDYVGQAMISNASCTTNCAATIAKVIHEAYRIRRANLLTVHAATAGQNSVDGTPPGRKGGDLRLARATLGNMIPTKTGAAKSVGDVLPALKGRFDGLSIRVPTPDGSFCYCTFDVEEAATLDGALDRLRAASHAPSCHGVLSVSDEPLVSSDIVHDPHSAIIDAPLVRVIGGTQVVIPAWYDNEWGYSNRMVDLLAYVVGPTLV